jgi:hypothetical protein
MTKLKEDKYTLVQHSAYGYEAKPGWDKAVETRLITTDVELARVQSVGGYVFDSYDEADTQEMKSNYPEGVGDKIMYPCVLGSFSHKELDGLKIYLPATQTTIIG